MMYYTQQQFAQITLNLLYPDCDDIMISNYLNDKNGFLKKYENCIWSREDLIDEEIKMEIEDSQCEYQINMDKFYSESSEDSVYHFSIFRWKQGEYWKNGEKKLEYICEMHTNSFYKSDFYNNFCLYTMHNDIERCGYEFFCFDMLNGQINITASLTINGQI